MRSMTPTASTMLLPVPEELVACILELLMRSLSDTLTSTTTATPSSSTSLSIFTTTLLVNSSFYAIAKPILYRSLHLKSESQAGKLADVICSQPSLGVFVRSLRVDGPCVGPALERIVGCINTVNIPLDVLDVKLDDEDCSETGEDKFQSFARALQGVKDARRLVLRKSGYLTKVTTRQAIYEIASSLVSWQNLEHVELKYKVSPVPATSAGMFPSLEQKLKEHCQTLPNRAGFLDPLALALSCSKKLKVVRAQMPALYNSFLLDVSANASVERIELLDGSESKECPFPLPRPRSRGMSDVAHSPSSPFPLSLSPSTTVTTDGPSARFDDERKMNEKVWASKIVATPISDETAIAEFDGDDVPPPAPASLFMQQAAKHPRLHALVLAGRKHMFLQDMRHRGLRGNTSRRPPPLLTTGPPAKGTSPPTPITSRTRAHSALPTTPTSLATRGAQSITSN